MLLKRFEVSRNLSYDAMLQFLRSDGMGEDGGPLASLDVAEFQHGEQIALPGVAKGEFSKRRLQPQISVSAVQFAPSGELSC